MTAKKFRGFFAFNATPTADDGESIDLDRLRRYLDYQIGQGVNGMAVIGSTGAIGAIEFEPGLERDLPEILDRLMPPSLDYGHEQAWHDGNGHSHLQATMLGPSLHVPVTDNRTVLGTWQQVFHLECDVRPRSREIVITVTG